MGIHRQHVEQEVEDPIEIVGVSEGMQVPNEGEVDAITDVVGTEQAEAKCATVKTQENGQIDKTSGTEIEPTHSSISEPRFSNQSGSNDHDVCGKRTIAVQTVETSTVNVS